jgi:tRNA (mo5U34)-methyltransferase
MSVARVTRNRDDASNGRSGLEREVAKLDWYHTIELPDGVVTPGVYDHRRVVKRLPLPESFRGKRCLDVASSDGFWAFEMARRGADEVVSVDLADAGKQDWQGAPGPDRTAGSGRAAEAFALCRRALGFDIARYDMSVYDVSPKSLGTFDFVFMGNILLHLRDPFLALQQVRTVTNGELFSFEAISAVQTLLRPFTPSAQLGLNTYENHWWTPNLAGHTRMLEAGGFEVLRRGGPLVQPFGTRVPRWPKRLRPERYPVHEAVFWLLTRQFGACSGWVIARPAP